MDRNTKGVVRVHDEESLDIDLPSLAVLEGILELFHDRLIKTVLGVGVSVFHPNARLVEEVQLEAPIDGSACEEGFSRIGEGPGNRIMHGGCGGRDAYLGLGNACMGVEKLVEVLGESAGEVMAAGGATAIKEFCSADFVLVLETEMNSSPS